MGLLNRECLEDDWEKSRYKGNEDYFKIRYTRPGASITGVSSMLICSLTREGTDADDTLLQDVYCAEVDFHYQKDSFGSRTRTMK